MNNAKLINALRICSTQICCDNCPRLDRNPDEEPSVCATNLLRDAADALEAADKRIAELEDDLRNSKISNPERFKIYNYTVKDLILFADICKRNDVREEDLKQAAWNLELAVRAVMNERQEIIENEMKQITMRFTPDFEKAVEEMMPNCGAKMDGGKDK